MFKKKQNLAIIFLLLFVYWYPEISLRLIFPVTLHNHLIYLECDFHQTKQLLTKIDDVFNAYMFPLQPSCLVHDNNNFLFASNKYFWVFVEQVLVVLHLHSVCSLEHLVSYLLHVYTMDAVEYVKCVHWKPINHLKVIIALKQKRSNLGQPVITGSYM